MKRKTSCKLIPFGFSLQQSPNEKKYRNLDVDKQERIHDMLFLTLILLFLLLIIRVCTRNETPSKYLAEIQHS